MKIIPAPTAKISPRPSWRRRACRVMVCGLLLGLGATHARAQISIGTLAGAAGSPGATDATGADARFNNPTGIAVDTSSGANAGTIYVADASNHTIRRITAAGVVTTLAGLAGTAGNVDGTGTAARFKNPQGLALDSAGTTLYVADTGNSTIRRVVIASGDVTTLAGSAGTFSSAEGTGTAAQFNGPTGVAISVGDDALYVADNGNHTLRRVTLPGAVVSTLAGSAGNPGVLNGTGAVARFFLPRGVSADATSLYVADSGNHAIRQIVIATGAVTTLAGTLGTSGSTDATGSAASFKNPGAVAARGANLYVADSGNSTLRQIVISTGVTTTLAGTAGQTGATDAIGAAARFALSSPVGLAADGSGNFYLTDTANHTIRKGGPAAAPAISAQPANQSVGVGGTVTFTVTATGNPTPTYQWQRQAGGTGAFADLPISPPYSGVTSATLTITGVTAAMNGDKFRCIVTNGPGTVTSNVASLLVTQAPAFTSAASAQFAVGVPGSFTVAASGSPAPTFAITAGANPSTIGVTLSPEGVLSGTPTSATGSPISFTITATSAGAGSITQNFVLTVQTGAAIATAPANVTAAAGTNATFTVVASGVPSTFTYQWYRAPASDLTNFQSLGTGSATYTGTQTATLTVVSTTVAMSGDVFRCAVSNGFGLPATSAAATLAVTQLPAFTSAATTTFAVGQASTFQVQATGSPAPTFSIAAGTSPATVGVSLSATGLLSGTPTTTTGTPFTFTISATNTAGTTTQSFTLNLIPVGALPSFTTQPASQSATIGGTATFAVVAAGLPAPALQWQRQPAGTTGFVNLANNATYGGATTATLTVAGVTTGMTGDQFQCVATNTGGSATSTAATFTANVDTPITTFAGLAAAAGSIDATGTAARFNSPGGLALDGAGNLYIADTVNCIIRKITPAGVVTTLAGLAGVAGSADGPAATARFNGPYGIAVDSTGNVYVADTFNHTIRVIAASGNVTTLAGLAGTFGVTDDTGAAARFAFPTGVAVGPGGVVYVADSFNHTIRAIAAGGVVSTYAGVAGVRGSADGLANIGGFAGSARFANPNAVAADSAGNVYVADSFNHTIRKITPTGLVSTLAGTAGTPGSVDGTGAAARFNQPSGLCVDSAGNVYVADTFNHTIRKITAVGVVTTVAGLAGASGSTDDAGSAARFNQPYGVVVDGRGGIFIVDTRNHTIRRNGTTFAPIIATQPASRAVLPGQNATFTVAASGSPSPRYQWRRQPAGTTGFVNLANGATYSGVTTATLTVTGVTTAMEGDQFQCVVSNFVSPDAVTGAVTLSASLVAPVFTSAASTSFTVNQAGSFTVAASGTPAPAFSAAGLPTWATLNPTTGVLSGTPPDAAGAPFAVTFTASNSATATQNFTLNVIVPVIAPAISTPPASLSLSRGATATFTVAASGTAPLAYQWSKDGLAIAGATGATLALANVQSANVGNYAVTITNAAGSVTSGPAALALDAVPVITAQPRSQIVAAGGTATFTVAATASPPGSYQWRFNGVPIAGATNAVFAVINVQSGSAGNYDVVVSNALGSVTSSLAQLNFVSTSAAPAITASPASQTVLAGGAVSLSVSAAGVPAPAYQWRKNGAAIAGATNARYTVTAARSTDAGDYDVVVTNAVDSTVSQAATVRVIARSYAGVYLGTFGGATGSFALCVRPDNTAVFLGFLAGSAGLAGLAGRDLVVTDSGGFGFVSTAGTIAGGIAGSGAIAGTLSGPTNASFTGSRLPDVGATQALAGFYQAGVTNGSGTAYAIVGATGQIVVLTQAGAQSDGGSGTLDNANRVAITTANGVLTVALTADGTALTVSSVRNNQATVFSGASEALVATQRLANISTRARVDAGANIAVAGFVIAGNESKPVLLRAIGPTLASFGVPTALGAPKLELYRGNTVIAANAGWATAGNTAAIVAATQQAGAFALTANSADAVIFTTLPPGAYTAQVSAASGGAGVALIEVYDLSAAAAGQKLLNISTRATAGAGDATLIAGIAVSGTAPKRVLVRAVGPGLAQFGLAGVLTTPQLQIVKDGQVVASNTGLNTSPDAAAIVAVSAQVGAFALPANSADCALLVSLAPGNYSATVSGVGGATGLAIVEVYEVP